MDVEVPVVSVTTEDLPVNSGYQIVSSDVVATSTSYNPSCNLPLVVAAPSGAKVVGGGITFHDGFFYTYGMPVAVSSAPVEDGSGWRYHAAAYNPANSPFANSVHSNGLFLEGDVIATVYAICMAV